MRPLDWENLKPSVQRLLHNRVMDATPYWLAATVAGLAAAGYAMLFSIIEEINIEWLNQNPYLIFVLAPPCFILASWLVRHFAPAAAGSGIPQVMAAYELCVGRQLNKVNELIGLRTAIVKVLSSMLLLLGGGAIGREGPTIQITAALFHFIRRKVHPIWPHLNPRSWIVAGGAAGIAAAFNTPLGGIVYAIEELSTDHFNRFKTLLITAVIIAGVVAQSLLGSYLYFGFPNLGGSSSLAIVPEALLVGGICGAAGCYFCKTLHWWVRWKRIFFKKGVRHYIFVFFSALAFAGLIYAVGDKGVGPGKHLVQDFLFKGESPGLALVAARFLGSILTYLSGAAGGIFAPALAIGAGIGAELSEFLPHSHPNLLAVLGMIAFLTGVTRAPFTAFVLVLEMTDRHSAIIPMMITSLSAHSIARIIDPKSFYEKTAAHLIRKKLPPRE